MTVTDSKNCTATQSWEIGEGSGLTLVGNISSNVACNGGSNGAINTTVTGGDGNYTYTWSPAGFGNVPNISNLSAGTYSLTVVDGNGCDAMDSWEITQPTVVVLTGTVTAETAPGANDGTIDLTVGGGTPGYNYDWDQNQYDGMEDLSGLSPATYCVTVTDQNGCAQNSCFTVNAAGAPQVNVLSFTNPTCNGAADGTINIEVSGGTPNYSYAWSDPGAPNSPNRTGLAAGQYSVTVTDANSITAVLGVPVSLTDPAPIVVGLNTTDLSCPGANDGTATATVQGGTMPYTYNWSTPGANNSPTISPLAAGPVTVNVVDANGCTGTAMAVVNAPQQIQIVNAVVDPVDCSGPNSGGINITVSGGTGALDYLWSTGAVSQDISGVSLGSYTVTITDANGCQIISSAIDVNGVSVPDIQAADVIDVVCPGEPGGSISLQISGGVQPFTYEWENCDLGISLGGSNTDVLDDLIGGNYCVTVTDAKWLFIRASGYPGG